MTRFHLIRSGAPARWDEYNRVTRALSLRAPMLPGLLVVVADTMIACQLGGMLNEVSVMSLPQPALYSYAEHVARSLDSSVVKVTFVILASNAWGERFASAAAARGWPAPFEPMRGLRVHERAAFIRRASNAARKGKPVCGIKPWGAR